MTQFMWIKEKYLWETLELFGLCLENEIYIYYWYISLKIMTIICQIFENGYIFNIIVLYY